MVKFLVIFFGLIAIISATTVDSKNVYSYPDSEKCEVDGVKFDSGLHKRPFPDKCMFIYCTPDGVPTVVQCPKYVGPPKDCEYGEYLHPDADYPLCCRKKIICKDDD